jgi:hypothetical protein
MPPELTTSTISSSFFLIFRTEISLLPALTASRNRLPWLMINAPCEASGSVAGSGGCGVGLPAAPVGNSPGSQSVASFRVWKNGNLTPVDTAGGLQLGAQGIAAK